LARLLNLDPSVRLQVAGVPIAVVQLIDPTKPLADLLQVAVRNRPEVLAASAAISASRARVNQEAARPFFPLLSVGYSAGYFGGGSNRVQSFFFNFRGRDDFDVFAVWTLQNVGLGNLAHVRERRAQVKLALAERQGVVNRVEREVADAYNLSAARLRDVDVARREVRTAVDGFQRDLTRVRAFEGRPIEVLNSAKLLARARQHLVQALVDYDEAQFQLFVALGQPPTLAVNDGPGCH
jgi:outer membrane protein TolC